MKVITTLEEMRAVWRRAGQKGGKARKEKLSAKRRREIARMGGLAKARKRNPDSAISTHRSQPGRAFGSAV